MSFNLAGDWFFLPCFKYIPERSGVIKGCLIFQHQLPEHKEEVPWLDASQTWCTKESIRVPGSLKLNSSPVSELLIVSNQTWES